VDLLHGKESGSDESPNRHNLKTKEIVKNKRGIESIR